MINISFNIRNPWSNRWDRGHVWSGSLTQHKFWELQAMKTADIIDFTFSFTIRQDHAGLDFQLGLLGFALRFNVYDHRHWNTDVNAWESHKE